MRFERVWLDRLDVRKQEKNSDYIRKDRKYLHSEPALGILTTFPLTAIP